MAKNFKKIFIREDMVVSVELMLDDTIVVGLLNGGYIQLDKDDGEYKYYFDKYL